MMRSVTVLALLLAVVASGAAVDPPALVWGRDAAAAQLLAARSDGLAVLHFRDSALGEVDEMWSDPAVRAAAGGMAVVHLDPVADGDLFARLLGGRGRLGTVVIDGSGDVVAAAPGWADAESLAVLLRAAAVGAPALRAARAAAADGDGAAALALAEHYRALGSPRRCEEVLRSALIAIGEPAEGPARALAARCRERLARCLSLRGRVHEAREMLDAALRLGAQRSAPLRLTDALVRLAAHESAAAAELLAGLAEDKDVDEPDRARFALGMALHDLRRDAEAMAAFERLLAGFPTSFLRGAARSQLQHLRAGGPDHEH